MNAAAPRPRLFILSSRARDELLARAGELGWKSIAARRAAGADARFAKSGARLALIDRRELKDDDRPHARALAAAVERAGGAFLALVEGEEAADQAFADGATHIVDAGSGHAAFVRALQLAERHADRVRAAWPSAAIPPPQPAPAWAYQPGSREVELSPALARAAGFGTEGGRRVPLLELFRKLDAEGRRAARSAVERLRATGGATAFAHSNAGQRLAHHVDLAEDARTLVGWVEQPAAPPGLGAMLDLDLDDALGADQIEIVWQPQVQIATGEMVGVEALARWAHPRLGQLDAPTLFAAAARTGRSAELNRRIVDQAFRALARWPAPLRKLRVAVNVTAADLAAPDFVSRFRGHLADLGIDHRRITVEVTESELIEELSIAAGRLAALRQAGLKVAVDDFGTGYSSLAYLKALPLDYLKIDRQLAQDIEGSPRDRVVVRGVIDMARALGLSVIAEGVETRRQLELLAAEGCTLYQGFLFSRPLTTEALARLVGAPSPTRSPAKAGVQPAA